MISFIFIIIFIIKVKGNKIINQIYINISLYLDTLLKNNSKAF